MNAEIKIGCCGFPVAQEHYFQSLRVVEIQRTFYNPPSDTTVQKWREGAPPGFEYTVKAWQVVTHPPKSPTYRKAGIEVAPEEENQYGYFRRTPATLGGWEAIRRVAEILNARVILFQTPPSFEPSSENKENIRIFLTVIERGNFSLVWEPRGKWLSPSCRDDLQTLCEELHIHCCVDPFITEPLPTSLAYFRLHGKGETGLRYHYTPEDFHLLWSKIQGISQPQEIYVFFNNINMYEDAVNFQNFLRQEGIKT